MKFNTWTLSAIAALGLIAVPVTASAGHHGVSLHDCLASTKNVRAGEFVKVEYLVASPRGGPAYSIEVRDADGLEWELTCSASTGEIYEIETEVESSEDPSFSEPAKINVSKARDIATGTVPGSGKIVEREYEIVLGDGPAYEFDIIDNQGTEWKVEVDAVTGDVIDLSVELWEIGIEQYERLDSPATSGGA